MQTLTHTSHGHLTPSGLLAPRLAEERGISLGDDAHIRAELQRQRGHVGRAINQLAKRAVQLERDDVMRI